MKENKQHEGILNHLFLMKTFKFAESTDGLSFWL